jgi:hypothetical protein
MATKYTKWPQNIPNGHKIYQIAVKGPNVRKIYQHLPLKVPLKCAHISIFGLKISHLATLMETHTRETVKD